MSQSDDLIKYLAIALVVGTLAYSSQRGASQGGTSQSGVADARASTQLLASPSARAEQLICQYLGESSPSCDIPADLDARFLIGLVPDPVDSDARWMFDSSLDAIHSAIAQQGFTLFRASFPDWQPSVQKAPDLDAQGVARHEREPAVLIFHREPAPVESAPPARQLLIVFLAYETPTGGVHAEALSQALSFQRYWEERPGSEAHCTTPVRILGPSFSGSSASLRQVIDRFHEDDPCPGGTEFRIVTGSATSASNQLHLAAPHTTFKSAVLSDAETLPALFQFVLSRFVRKAHLAILIESTPYGDALSQTNSRIDPDGHVPGDDHDHAHIDTYRFPLHISQLRPSGAGSAPGDGVRTPLTFADRLEPTDRLPVMTPDTTAPTVELMLDSLFDQLRRHRVDAVGLFATDTRDKLFLSRQLARAIPGLLLFTTEVDVLYSHPQYSSAVRGMIVASSYPPVPTDTVTGSGDVPSRYMFPGSLALGTFNAALSLLADLPSPPRVPDLLEYRSENDASPLASPLVWLSVVTNSGVWPVEHQKANQDNANQDNKAPYSQLRDSKPRDGRESEASVWVWVATVVLVLLALCHLTAHLSVSKWKSRLRWFAALLDFSIYTEGPHARYLLVSETALLVELLLFAGAWSTGLRHVEDGMVQWHFEEIAAVLLLVVGGCGLLWAMARTMVINLPSFGTSGAGSPSQHRLRRTVSGVGLLLGASAVICLAVYGRRVVGSWTDPDAHMLFFDRAMHPASLSSPLFVMGLVVAPIYLWGLFQASAAGRTPMDQLALVVRSLAAGQADRHQDSLLTAFLGALERPFQTLPAKSTFLVLAGVVLVVLAFFGKPAASVETWWFTAAFIAAWLVVQLLLTICLAQALEVWRQLTSLLKALGAHPMAAAYLRVPRQMLGDRLSPRRPSLMTLSTLVDARRRLLAPLPVPAEQPSQFRPEIDQAIVTLGTTAFDFDEDVAASPQQAWTKTPTFAACTKDAIVIQRTLAGTWWQRTAAGSDKPLQGWCRRAEEFLGIFVVLFVRETLSRLANTLYFLVPTVLLLVATQVMFTFHPRQMFLGLAWVYALLTVGAAMYVFVSLERSRVMSMLASTENGKIRWDRSFWSKMLLYAIVPMMTLFAAQFPQVGEALVRLIGPVQPPPLMP